MLFWLVVTVYAQEKPLKFHIAPLQDTAFQTSRFWIDISAGGSLNSEDLTETAACNLHYLTRTRRHIQLRGLYFTPLLVMFGGSSYENTEIAWLTGWMKRKRNCVMELAVGLSYNFGYTSDVYHGKKVVVDQFGDISTQYYTTVKINDFNTVGLPFEFDIKRLKRMPVGLGFTVKGNLNLAFSYIMAGIEMNIFSPVRLRKTK